MSYLPRDRRAGSAFAWGIVVALLLIAPGVRAASQQALPSPATAPNGNSVTGKTLYNSVGCWQCHGYSGQGGAGSSIAPDPIPYSAFTQYIRAPKGSMPPYSTKVLADKQLADIYAFLKTIPQPRDPKDIPLLNQDLE